MKRKKICYVVTIPLTIRSFFIPQLKFLAEHGFDVTVICGNDDNLKFELGDSIKFIPLDIPRGMSFLGSLKTINKLMKIFKIEQFDLIQYSTPNASLYSAIAAKIVGCKVRNYHCMGFRYLGFNGLIKSIFKMTEKITCWLSTDIECVSKSNLELGIKEGLFNKSKAAVVFHGSTGGVDLNRFDFSKRQKYRDKYRLNYKITTDDFVYGFVGRITKDKGVNELIKAYMEVEKRISNTKLVFIGYFEKKNNLDDDLLDYTRNNNNIIFINKVDNIEEYYPLFDVLVLPSYREGFGNVVIEAEAMGVPVIVSDIPGPRDAMKNNFTGLLIPPKNITELSKSMIEIKDIYRKKEYIKNCYEFVKKRFDNNQLCKEILDRKISLLKEEKSKWNL